MRIEWGVFAIGLALVCYSFASAVHMFMLPGSFSGNIIVRLSFRQMQTLMRFIAGFARTESGRNTVLGLYAPVCLLVAFAIGVAINGLGFAAMFYGIGQRTVKEAFVASGSALSTLGFTEFSDIPPTALSVVEALMTTTMSALLIGYLPTVYSAYLNRESAMTALLTRLGPVKSSVEILTEFQKNPGLEHLGPMWKDWATWLTSVGQSHTSLSGVLFLRSPRGRESWVTMTAMLMDAAALMASVVDLPVDKEVTQCLAAGENALWTIMESIRFTGNRNATWPETPIAITRQDFDTACAQMAAAGIPLKADRDAAWKAYAEIRVRFDAPLMALHRLKHLPTPHLIGMDDSADFGTLKIPVFGRRSLH